MQPKSIIDRRELQRLADAYSATDAAQKHFALEDIIIYIEQAVSQAAGIPTSALYDTDTVVPSYGTLFEGCKEDWKRGKIV